MKNRFGYTFKSPISIALSFSLLAQPFLAPLAQAQSGQITQSISYDTNGNMTQDENGNTYEYDAENKLISFVKGDGTLKTEYTYYANGLRKSKQITLKDKSASTPIAFYYDHAKNANVVNEVQGSGSTAVTSGYLMVGDTRYARYLSNDANKPKYYVKNHKDTTMTVGANGADPISHSYTPYGEERDSKGSGVTTPDFSIASNPFLYSSQYSDAESGLQYLRARYYKADHMRFISRDTNSKPRNKYAYANGNPIMEDDPSGMMASWVKYALGGIGIAASVAGMFVSGGSTAALTVGILGGLSGVASEVTGLQAQEGGKNAGALNTASLITGIASIVLGVGEIAAGRLVAKSVATGGERVVAKSAAARTLPTAEEAYNTGVAPIGKVSKNPRNDFVVVDDTRTVEGNKQEEILARMEKQLGLNPKYESMDDATKRLQNEGLPTIGEMSPVDLNQAQAQRFNKFRLEQSAIRGRTTIETGSAPMIHEKAHAAGTPYYSPI